MQSSHVSQLSSKSLVDERGSIMLRIHPSSYPHSMWRLSNALYIFDNLHPGGNPRRDDIQQALAGTIARCSLLLLGSDARIIIMLIIQRVWGAKDTIRKNLSGPHRDLALIRQCHVSLSKIAINTTYGQLPTLTMHSSSTMTLSTAIHQAFETSSDHSRIPPLPNTFVRSWHRAPNASTSWSEPTKQYDRSLLHHLWGHRRVLV